MRQYVEQRIIQLVLFALSIWIIWQLMPALSPFLVAFVLAYLVNPLTEKLERLGLPHWAAVVSVFVVASVCIVLLLTLLIPIIWDQGRYAITHFPVAVEWFNTKALPWMQHQLPFKAKYMPLSQLSPDAMVKLIQKNYSLQTTQQILSAIAHSGMGAISFFGLIVLVPIALFYFLMDWPRIVKNIWLVVPRRIAPKLQQIAAECDYVVRAFIKGQLTVMIVLAVFYSLGLQLIGIQVALIIGVVAGFSSVVPYLGVAVGICSALTAVLFQYGFDWTHIALVGLVFVLAHILESYLLQPFLLGNKIGLSPIAVIFSVVAGGSLAGIIGMLVALPITAVCFVIYKHILAYYLQTSFYGYHDTAASQSAVMSDEVSVIPTHMSSTRLCQHEHVVDSLLDQASADDVTAQEMTVDVKGVNIQSTTAKAISKSAGQD